MGEIIWLGHASFKLDLGKKIYFDPYNIKTVSKDGDLIFVSHTHFDHYSEKDIKKVAKDGAVLIVPCDVKNFPGLEVKNVKPGDTFEIENIKIEVVPAYNKNKTFHPKANNWVGYVVEADAKRYYHAGDTDFIDEMKNLKNIDFAFLPVSGTYVMTADEAAQAAKVINPKTAIPMHWGAGIVGDISDAQKFQSLLENSPIKVEILSPS